MFFKIILLSLSFSINLYAGQDGGGGNAVACFSSSDHAEQVKALGYVPDSLVSKVSTLKILEETDIKNYYKNSSNYIVKTKPNESPFDYYSRIANRFKLSLPNVTKDLMSIAKKIPKESFIYLDTPINQTRDFNLAANYETDNCAIVVIAYQYNETKDKKVVQIDNRLYRLLSGLQKAILTTHEYVYALAIERGHINSDKTRTLVSLLALKTNGQMAKDWSDQAYYTGIIKNLSLHGYQASYDNKIEKLILMRKEASKEFYKNKVEDYFLEIKNWLTANVKVTFSRMYCKDRSKNGKYFGAIKDLKHYTSTDGPYANMALHYMESFLRYVVSKNGEWIYISNSDDCITRRKHEIAKPLDSNIASVEEYLNEVISLSRKEFQMKIEMTRAERYNLLDSLMSEVYYLKAHEQKIVKDNFNYRMDHAARKDKKDIPEKPQPMLFETLLDL